MEKKYNKEAARTSKLDFEITVNDSTDNGKEKKLIYPISSEVPDSRVLGCGKRLYY